MTSLLFVVLNCCITCKKRIALFSKTEYYKRLLQTKLTVSFNNMVLIIFYDNLLHFLTSLMFVKSGVFGVYDFALTSIRGFVFVNVFFFLHRKREDADDFAEYQREFNKIQVKTSEKSIQANFFRKFKHSHESHYHTQTKRKYKEYTSTKHEKQEYYSKITKHKSTKTNDTKYTKNLNKNTSQTNTYKASKTVKPGKPSNFSNFKNIQFNDSVIKFDLNNENSRFKSKHKRDKSKRPKNIIKVKTVLYSNKLTLNEIEVKPASNQVPSIYLYVKNSFLFFLVTALLNKPLLSLCVVIYIQAGFTVFLFAFYGFGLNENLGIIAHELFLVGFLLYYINHHIQSDFGELLDLVYIMAYFSGISISVMSFFFDLFYSMKSKLK